MGMFLAKQYNYLAIALPHKQMDVLCANNITTNSTTPRQLNLSPDLLPNAQIGYAFNEIYKTRQDKTPVSVPVLRDAGCDVIFKEKWYKCIKRKT